MNIYKALIDLLPKNVTDVGTIVEIMSGTVRVELQRGAGNYITVADGGSSWNVGDRVYIKGGVVIGDAPNLNGNIIEI